MALVAFSKTDLADVRPPPVDFLLHSFVHVVRAFRLADVRILLLYDLKRWFFPFFISLTLILS